jgi:hypothetical protein
MPEKRVNEYHAHMVTKKAEMREVNWMMCISRSTEGETKTIEPNVEIYNRALTEVRMRLDTRNRRSTCTFIMEPDFADFFCFNARLYTTLPKDSRCAVCGQ